MAELRKTFKLLMFMLLLSSQEKMEQTEAIKTCEALSRFFLGFCLFDYHCDMACKMESYTTGKCLGLQPHCICLKTCYQPQTPLPPPATPPVPEPATPPAAPPKTPKPPHHLKPPCVPSLYPPYKDPPKTPTPPQYTPDPPKTPTPPQYTPDPPKTPTPPQYTPDPPNPSNYVHSPNSHAKPSRILKSRHLSRSAQRSSDYSSKWCREHK